VCACWDAGFRPRPRHAAAASAPAGRAARPPARRPVMGGGSSEIAKGVGRSPQVGNSLWVKDRPRWPWALVAHGHGRTSRAHPLSAGPAAGSTMEDTSGAADPGPLRGGTEDATLGGIAEGAIPNGVAPDRAGVSSRRGSGSTTRGVRADRVGKKTLLRSPARVTSEERRSSKRGAILAREDSTGERSSRFSAGRKAGDGQARRHHPGSVQGLSSSREASVMRAGAVCAPRGSGAGERSARAHVRAVPDGDRAVPWACSRVVVVAEVDERRLVQTC